MWVASYTASIGAWDIGVRVDDPAVDEVVRQELGDALRPNDNPPPGYSVCTTLPGSGGVGRELPSLRHGCRTVLRSRRPLRLAHALFHHVLSHPAPPATTLRLRTAAVVHDGGVVLLPGRLLRDVGSERQLERAGLRPVDSPVVDLDREGRAVVRPWDLHGVTSHALQPVRWYVDEYLFDGIEPQRPSFTLAAASKLIDRGSTVDAQTALSLVASRLPIIRPAPGTWSTADVVADLGRPA